MHSSPNRQICVTEADFLQPLHFELAKNDCVAE
jgi:hypothetical protein